MSRSPRTMRAFLLFPTSLIYSLIISLMSSPDSVHAAPPYSLEFAVGLYHPFAKPPGDLDPEDQFDLRNGVSLSAGLFRHSLWDGRRHRTGFGLDYQMLYGNASQDPMKISISDRTYHMVSLKYVIQIGVVRTESSMVIADVVGRLSFAFSNKDDPCAEAFFCIYPLPGLGLQAGIAYMIRLQENWAIRFGLRPQLQTGRNEVQYPFSYGVVFDIGFNFDLR